MPFTNRLATTLANGIENPQKRTKTRQRGLTVPASKAGPYPRFLSSFRPDVRRFSLTSLTALLLVTSLLAPMIATPSAVAAQPIATCLKVLSKGKPVCPGNQDAICTERVTCLNTQFPATTAKPCVRWQCEPIKAKKEPAAG